MDGGGESLDYKALGRPSRKKKMAKPEWEFL